MSERYLGAYYYGFNATGVDAIDAILEAVASAGKGCHNTADWTDYPSTDESYVDKIQQAANDAAKLMSKK